MPAGDLAMALRRILSVAVLLVVTGVAMGYLVGPPLSLEKLTAEADLVFKGTVLSGEPVQDEWFKPCPGFVGKGNRVQGHLGH